MSASERALEIRALVPEDLPALVAGFNRAFSDYPVPVRVTLEELRGLVLARGISWDLSLVATEGTEIRAFWLTGTELAGRRLVAYDIATGVDPDFRRSGLAQRLFREIRRALVAVGASSWQLEVIEENDRATALYRGLGFEVARRLLCYQSDRAVEPVAKPNGVRIAEAERPSWDALLELWDWPPAWPSGIGTIERSGGDAKIFLAHSGGNVVGYCAILVAGRSLAQLAVARRYRRKGVGRALLAAGLDSAGGEMGFRVLNVPEAAVPMRGFLAGLGATVFTTQLEMTLEP